MVGDVVGDMASAATRELLTVPTRLAYPVRVQRGLLTALSHHVSEAAPAFRYVIIADETVHQLHGAAFRAGFPSDHTLVLTVPPGESEKTREQWARLTDAMLHWGAGRDTTVIAVGGGVVCDLAGFVAATFMRGVPVVQVPTTLLAMVDASVGGKTGVDTAAGKNLVGAFHNPSAVLVDPDVLTTLPGDVFRSGLAEMIKHGVLADAAYFEALFGVLEILAGRNGAHADALPTLIADSIAIKAAVVVDDERESGRRETLNFGHTIAHALEQQAHYDMLHGDAVAIGMVVEAEIAVRMKLAPAHTISRIREALVRAQLPYTLPEGVNIPHLLATTHGDKKARHGAARYALPTGIGKMGQHNTRWSFAVPDDLVTDALHSVLHTQ